MRKLFIFIISVSILSAQFEYLNIIKYKKWGKIVYDTYTTIHPFGSYVMTIRERSNGTVTNFIYGEFETMNFEEYQRIKK